MRFNVVFVLHWISGMNYKWWSKIKRRWSIGMVPALGIETTTFMLSGCCANHYITVNQCMSMSAMAGGGVGGARQGLWALNQVYEKTLTPRGTRGRSPYVWILHTTLGSREIISRASIIHQAERSEEASCNCWVALGGVGVEVSRWDAGCSVEEKREGGGRTGWGERADGDGV